MPVKNNGADHFSCPIFAVIYTIFMLSTLDYSREYFERFAVKTQAENNRAKFLNVVA